MSLFKQWIFLQSEVFFNRITFFERGYKHLFWIHNLIWQKKNFTETNKIFVKIIHIFSLKKYIILQIVLLHLNNHSLLHTNSSNVWYACNYFISHNYNKITFVERLIKLKILLNAAIIYYVKIDYNY